MIPPKLSPNRIDRDLFMRTWCPKCWLRRTHCVGEIWRRAASVVFFIRCETCQHAVNCERTDYEEFRALLKTWPNPTLYERVRDLFRGRTHYYKHSGPTPRLDTGGDPDLRQGESVGGPSGE